MADNYPFDSDNVPYSAVFNQDYTADSALAISTETAQTSVVSLITIAAGAGGTSAGVGGTGGSVTTLDTTYSASRGSYSGGDGGTGGGALGNGAGGGGAAGYAGVGGNAGSGAAANSGGGGGGGASTNQLLLGGGGVGLFGKGTTGAAGTASTAAGGGSTFNSTIGDVQLQNVKLLLKGGTDTPYNLGNPESFSVTRNGSTTGASRFVTGKYGNAFDFNGTDDYLALSDGDLSGGDWTIEMWVNWDSLSNAIISTDNSYGPTSGNDSGEWQLNWNAGTSQLQFGIAQATNINGPSLSANTWYHTALSYDASSTTLYLGVNGTVYSATDANYADIKLGVEPALQIARNRTGNNFFNGQIDDIRFTKGVARYTSSYTVPAAAHPIIHARSGNNGFKDSAEAQADYA